MLKTIDDYISEIVAMSLYDINNDCSIVRQEAADWTLPTEPFSDNTHWVVPAALVTFALHCTTSLNSNLVQVLIRLHVLCGAFYTVECVRNVVDAENICLSTQGRRQIHDYSVIGNVVLCFLQLCIEGEECCGLQLYMHGVYVYMCHGRSHVLCTDLHAWYVFSVCVCMCVRVHA